MSTHGPQAGTASLIAAQREKAKALDLPSPFEGVRASPDVVAKLTAAKAYFAAGGEKLALKLGAGPAIDLGAGDVDLALGLCAEAYARFDATNV